MLHWPESTCFWQTESCLTLPRKDGQFSLKQLSHLDRTIVLMDWPIQLATALQEHKVLTTLWSWLVCSLPLSPKAVLHTMSNFPTAVVTFCFKIQPLVQCLQCFDRQLLTWLLTFHMRSLVSKCKKCTRLQGERNTGSLLRMQSSVKISNWLQINLRCKSHGNIEFCLWTMIFCIWLVVFYFILNGLKGGCNLIVRDAIENK